MWAWGCNVKWWADLALKCCLEGSWSMMKSSIYSRSTIVITLMTSLNPKIYLAACPLTSFWDANSAASAFCLLLSPFMSLSLSLKLLMRDTDSVTELLSSQAAYEKYRQTVRVLTIYNDGNIFSYCSSFTLILNSNKLTSNYFSSLINASWAWAAWGLCCKPVSHKVRAR